MEALRAPHLDQPRGQLDLERILEWIFLLPILLHHKSPSVNGTKAKDLNSFVQRRCDQYDLGDWKGLTAEYKVDAAAAQSVYQNGIRPQGIRDEAKICKVLDIFVCMQCSKVQ